MDSTPRRSTPTEIANDTFVIHAHRGGEGGVVLAVNAMLIRGVRPVVVDTGSAGHREQFLDDVRSLVDPVDIGWVILSHDDPGRADNLHALMQIAPQATLLYGDRLARIDVGDRTLSVVRPPVAHWPHTRGVFDPTTGVYWAADTFGAALVTPVGNVSELDPDEWSAGMVAFVDAVAPWMAGTDDRAFQSSIDLIEGLGASVIAGIHTPVIGRDVVHLAISTLRQWAAVAPSTTRAGLELQQIRQLTGG